MPDENRVFDVTKPAEVSPSATSRPIIVGHHPITADPMVRDSVKPSEPPMHIRVIDGNDNAPHSQPPAGHGFSEAQPPAFTNSEPTPEPEPQSPGPLPSEAEPVQPEASPVVQPPIEALHFSNNKTKRRWWKLSLLIVLLLLIGAYLAIDSGLISTGINLPFHIFKQKQTPTSSSSSSPSSNNQPATTAPAIPTGFKNYQLSGTNLTFAAPLTWGAPTSTADPGYSKRGIGQSSDGAHAYLVNFADNKDIQLAVTSNKYLPASRSPQYYDYLQWCSGTNDGQIYQSTLHYTTAAGIDTPSTVVCDQGPLTNIIKLDSKTIVQSQVTNASGKVIGDIYTKNLSDPSLVVFRAKDSAMTNGDDIKQLLSTIQFSSSSQ